MMKKTRFTPIKLLVCMMGFIGFAPASFAQTDATTPAAEKSMEVKRIALVDLDGVLRAADANNRVRELLDGQRAKFQEEFRAIEVDLQQSERDLLAKRDLMAKDEYDKLVTAFQARVSSVQKEIQYKRQSIDNAYQKALSDIRKLAIDVITKIASERKIDLILNRDSSVIFLPHLNISDEVLSRLNERTKNARIEVEIKKPVAQ
ncbi:OmpH family outer membrane protein [Alphaproteobacteria bacterium]|jgi:outer membrane protein|nr:OmpH family outer membrane protein [Alphaproteobacteria bacterium]